MGVVNRIFAFRWRLAGDTRGSGFAGPRCPGLAIELETHAAIANPGVHFATSFQADDLPATNNGIDLWRARPRRSVKCPG